MSENYTKTIDMYKAQGVDTKYIDALQGLRDKHNSILTISDNKNLASTQNFPKEETKKLNAKVQLNVLSKAKEITEVNEKELKKGATQEQSPKKLGQKNIKFTSKDGKGSVAFNSGDL